MAGRNPVMLDEIPVYIDSVLPPLWSRVSPLSHDKTDAQSLEPAGSPEGEGHGAAGAFRA